MLTAIKDVSVEVMAYSLEEAVDDIRSQNSFVADAVVEGFEVYDEAINKLRQALHEARVIEDDRDSLGSLLPLLKNHSTSPSLASAPTFQRRYKRLHSTDLR
jgi:hypothetical protein